MSNESKEKEVKKYRTRKIIEAEKLKDSLKESFIGESECQVV